MIYTQHLCDSICSIIQIREGGKAYAHITLFVQEKEAEDRGEESAGQEEERDGCKEWPEMYYPVVQINRSRSWCGGLGMLGPRLPGGRGI
jgi:hypothetical protein